MFGLDPKTAIRYAENARQLLITAAEENDPGDAAERKPAGKGPARGCPPAVDMIRRSVRYPPYGAGGVRLLLYPTLLTTARYVRQA